MFNCQRGEDHGQGEQRVSAKALRKEPGRSVSEAETGQERRFETLCEAHSFQAL